MHSKRRPILLAIICLTTAGVLAVQHFQAEARRQVAACLHLSDPPAATLAACTALINRGHAPDVQLSRYYYWRSRAHSRDGSDQDALNDIDQAVALNPRNPIAIGQRGWVHHQMESYDLALADLNATLRLDPDYVWALNARGNAQWSLGERDEALKNYDAALALNPKYIWALRARAQSLALMERTDEALLAYDQFFEVYPKDVIALRWRARLFRDLDRTAEEIADLERALAIDPQDQKSRRRLWAACARDVKACLSSPNAARPARAALSCAEAEFKFLSMLDVSKTSEARAVGRRWYSVSRVYAFVVRELRKEPNKRYARILLAADPLLDCYGDEKSPPGQNTTHSKAEFNEIFTPQMRRAAVELAMRHLQSTP